MQEEKICKISSSSKKEATSNPKFLGKLQKWFEELAYNDSGDYLEGHWIKTLFHYYWLMPRLLRNYSWNCQFDSLTYKNIPIQFWNEQSKSY